MYHSAYTFSQVHDTYFLPAPHSSPMPLSHGSQDTQQLSAHFHNVSQPSDTMSPVRYSIKMHSVETESIQDPSSIVLSPSGYRPVFQSVLYKSLHDKFHPELSIPGTFLLQHPSQNFHCLQYSLRHKSHVHPYIL